LGALYLALFSPFRIRSDPKPRILQTQSFFDRVQPANFYTFATPHIGLPRYPSFYSSLTYTLGPRWLSRTGEQFYGIDQWGSTGLSLLEVMADPEGVFYKGLEQFAVRRIYANAAGDVTVPYVTASIELVDPFFHYQTNGIKLTFDQHYPHLITKWELPTERPHLPEPALMSLEYIQSFVPTRPVLPPHLQFSYPYNYLFYALSPLLVPLMAPFVIAAIVYRFGTAARESRRRIALLESDEVESGSGAASPPSLSRRPTLLSLARSGTSTPTSTLERGTGPATSTSPPSTDGKPSAVSSSQNLMQVATKAAAAEREALGGEDAADGPVPDANTSAAAAGEQPMLTELQRRCARSLNELGFEKHLVLIEGVRNAHGPIICRAAFQTQGVDVLDHFAQHFEL